MGIISSNQTNFSNKHMILKKFVYDQLNKAMKEGIIDNDIKLGSYNDIDMYFWVILPDEEKISVVVSHTGFYVETLSKSNNDDGNPKYFSTQNDFYEELNYLAEIARDLNSKKNIE